MAVVDSLGILLSFDPAHLPGRWPGATIHLFPVLMIRTFLYRLLYFCLPLLLTLLALESLISNQKTKRFSEKKLATVFQNNGRAYQWVNNIHHPRKILLLGSSSVKYGLSGGQLNQLSQDSLCFINLAADARDPIETFFILQQIDLTNVKAMYMGIDPWIFTRNYYRNRHQYLLTDLSFGKALRYSRDYDLRLFAKRYKALFGLPDPDHRPAPLVSDPPDDFGSIALTRKPANFNDPVSQKFKLSQYGWSDLQFVYLQKIAALCKKRGIFFSAFYPPRRSDWVEDYRKNCFTVHTSFLLQLKKAGYLDSIRGNVLGSLPGGDGIFADGYHLNREGQKNYSLQWWEQLKQVLPHP
jgi:hypothetical protein